VKHAKHFSRGPFRVKFHIAQPMKTSVLGYRQTVDVKVWFYLGELALDIVH
jgi:hypothetical protein